MKEAVIIFTRVPVPGYTKTRLQKLLTPEECAELHACFLKDLKTCCEQFEGDCFIFYTPGEGRTRLIQILGETIPYFLQWGESLGDRMYHAISCVLHMDYGACVLVGSDIPELRPEDLRAAFAVLANKDVVLGPAADQGYYLVGMKKPHKEVFENQVYGHGSVLENTIEAIREAGLTFGFAPAHADIDEPEDILRYCERLKEEENNNSNTADYIREMMENPRNIMIS